MEQSCQSQPPSLLRGGRAACTPGVKCQWAWGTMRKVLLVKRRHGLSNAYLAREHRSMMAWAVWPKEERLPCVLQPLGSRDSWPCGQAHSVLHLHPRWVLEIKGKTLCCCNTIDVSRGVLQGSRCSPFNYSKLESSRLQFLPLACAGSIDHSNLT